MNSNQSILNIVKQTIDLQSDSIKNLNKYLNDDFVDCIQLILKSKGRVIVSGIGKSAIIAQKIVATFNSTGTPSIFMHAADAIHGDLGLIQKNDVVICISKSGNTPEIKALVPFIKENDSNKLIAITGDTNSFLATNSDFVLSSNVEKEACPNNLAPTTSTTAQLVIGDAIAVTLLKLRGFDSKDFAKYHPGGSLGKKLYLRVKDLIDTKNKPVINLNANISLVIVEMSEKMLGAVVVLNNLNKIIGIITDGDLRRQLVKSLNISQIKAEEIMTKNPLVINYNMMAIDALKLMKSKKISHLIVEENNKYYGIIHIQNIIKEGII
ncbi:KpsF/GutQ family sugar-phosphate isomerase [Flavobacteriaceae bacterium]|nr:KpsF/GutQ family sugar-phosphate isomerase [Flavobacteriaceae bacterium]MDB4196442.1 KpsF/GutQ family sugar-phosphate isomerase [Flavobacteriaceae bacterium]MDC0552215.1 KpsF/GutQ family sugar-phosphate isomerase [Flavobacteriaceae bacterium]MDC0623050.1 KpsF/GutQ family sugar-phosphate isomerase [Flavobacteriaceae bacterium]MDC1310539.1 KpsF/GutQ family sugar-phosphate isomerase [Flavobacteriaceae bacterium]